jgi:hypothetical protein
VISGFKSHDKHIYIGHPLDGLSGAVSARDFRGGPRQQHPSMNNMTISLNSPDDAETKDIEAGHAPVLSCPVSLSGSKMNRRLDESARISGRSSLHGFSLKDIMENNDDVDARVSKRESERGSVEARASRAGRMSGRGSKFNSRRLSARGSEFNSNRASGRDSTASAISLSGMQRDSDMDMDLPLGINSIDLPGALRASRKARARDRKLSGLGVSRTGGGFQLSTPESRRSSLIKDSADPTNQTFDLEGAEQGASSYMAGERETERRSSVWAQRFSRMMPWSDSERTDRTSSDTEETSSDDIIDHRQQMLQSINQLGQRIPGGSQDGGEVGESLSARLFRRMHRGLNLDNDNAEEGEGQVMKYSNKRLVGWCGLTTCKGTTFDAIETWKQLGGLYTFAGLIACTRTLMDLCFSSAHRMFWGVIPVQLARSLGPSVRFWHFCSACVSGRHLIVGGLSGTIA